MPIYEYQCKDCGEISEILVRTLNAPQEIHCKNCDSIDLTRLLSRPGLIRSQSQTEPGALRPVDPRRAVENMSRMYDQTGVDPGQGFSEVAKRAAAGDSPDTLKEVVKEAKQKEAKQSGK
ncbi:MAG TPA: zinc ribbon domain-containing protein [Anaerolineae bacterium]|nr:zinc ribbon domain-containing protein [Anaerolineae bacterium]HXV96791.1 zinc ribbon domain-containing protein [Anaerolineae bacterium]